MFRAALTWNFQAFLILLFMLTTLKWSVFYRLPKQNSAFISHLLYIMPTSLWIPMQYMTQPYSVITFLSLTSDTGDFTLIFHPVSDIKN